MKYQKLTAAGDCICVLPDRALGIIGECGIAVCVRWGCSRRAPCLGIRGWFHYALCWVERRHDQISRSTELLKSRVQCFSHSWPEAFSSSTYTYSIGADEGYRLIF
jgi:hypothetical protein